jgi:hypothetical protein
MITKPIPFEDAIRYLLEKEDLPAEWDSADWAAQEPDFRAKAFWSARVENARFLDRAHGLLFDYMAKVAETIKRPDGTEVIALKVGGREHFVKLMRDFMIAEGMADPNELPGVDQDDVTDIRSVARLRLIFDTNVRQAYGYGQWKQGTTPAVLRAFPAARLIRESGRAVPRKRHEENIGAVRLKSDPWWANYINDQKIGGFGVPWGPYGFGSGCNQEDVSRKEAIDAGLDVDGPGAPPPIKLSAQTISSVKGMDPTIKQKMLDELRAGPKSKDPGQAGKEAAARNRRMMLGKGLDEAVARGDEREAAKYREAIAELPAPGFSVIDNGDSIKMISNDQRSVEAADASVRRTVNQLAESVLGGLPGVSREWLSPVRPFFLKLGAYALSRKLVSDDAFMIIILTARADLPGLFDKLNTQALEDAFMNAISSAALAGSVRRYEQ